MDNLIATPPSTMRGIMFRWLSRYVKRIDIYGIGIELRELPESVKPSVPIPEDASASAAVTPPNDMDPPDDVDGVIELVRYIRISGVSASSQRKPRELDLTVFYDEIEFHIHDTNASRTKLWINRTELQNKINDSTVSGEIRIPARKSRSESEVVIVIDEGDEVEVQAHWWIWVPKDELKAAFKEIGITTNW